MNNFSNTEYLNKLLDSYQIQIPRNILYDISFNLYNNKYNHKHICFLINMKTNKVLSYGFNYYLNGTKFPFSLHSEVNVINKYYKKKIIKNLLKVKKYLIIIKLSKIGIIGNSKPCKHCATFIYNNYDNLKLSKIYYSTKQNTLEELNKNDLQTSNFKLASGFKKYVFKN
jgi:hypothetical protein